jgi:mannose-6-phosphate isomerase-like protein (cupin superfamily)
MFISRYEDCEEFLSGDETMIRELLSPVMSGVDVGYSLAHATLAPGRSTLLHRLKTSTEVYYIMSGTGLMRIDDERSLVRPGDSVFIPASSVQTITNTSEKDDLVFLCIVEPAWQESDEEIL